MSNLTNEAFKCLEKVFVILLLSLVCIVNSENVWGPPLPEKPFFVVWNSPSEKCEKKFGISIDLDDFDIVHNYKQKFVGEFMSIFYIKQIGLEPRYLKDGTAINGGIPQLGNLTAHLQKAADDIEHFIPDADFHGIAVIDWEDWRPIWQRNWDAKSVYQKESKKLVQQKHPDWNRTAILAKAKEEFEQAARSFMEETVLLGRRLRPKGHWGFYEYPDCYNHNGEKTCSPEIIKENDRLQWLWNVSSSVCPSMYLYSTTNSTTRAYWAYGQIVEGLRVATKNKSSSPLNVFPYSRYRYSDSLELYTKEDLLDTIKLAADLGASGLVLWDGSASMDLIGCQDLHDYLLEELGPLVKQVTDFALNCSRTHCHGNGRCVHKDLLQIEAKKTTLKYARARELCSKRKQDKSLRFTPYRDYTNTAHSENTVQGKVFCELFYPGEDRKKEEIWKYMDFVKAYDKWRNGAWNVSGERYTCKCYPEWSGRFCEKHK